MKIKVFFVCDSDSEEFSFLGTIEKSNTLEYLGYKSTSDDALSYLKSHEVDVIVVSLFKPQFDGFKLIEQIKKSSLVNQPKKIIAVTNFISNFVNSRLNSLEVDYVMVFPIDAKELESVIIDMFSNVEEHVIKSNDNNDPNLSNEISNILHDVGVPAHIRGYYYLRDAITIVYQNMQILNGVTKILYPMIAKLNDTTPTKVERAIRHAIQVAWTRGSAEAISEIFSHTISYQRNRPTNTEFIAMIADRLRLNHSFEQKVKYF